MKHEWWGTLWRWYFCLISSQKFRPLNGHHDSDRTYMKWSDRKLRDFLKPGWALYNYCSWVTWVKSPKSQSKFTWDSRGPRRLASQILPRGCPCLCQRRGCFRLFVRSLHGLRCVLLFSFRPWLLPSEPLRLWLASWIQKVKPEHKIKFFRINNFSFTTDTRIFSNKCSARQCQKFNMLWCKLVTGLYWAFIN